MKKVKIRNCSDEIQVGKIVCVGRNYAAHAAELGNEVPARPVLFLKPPSALIFSGESIIHPSFSQNMHHEVELVLLIGSDLKDSSSAEAERSIYAFGVGLDMTLRDIQDELKKNSHPWTIAKCFDTSAAVSEFILSADHKLTMNEELSLSVNSIQKQKEKLGMMLFPPTELVKYISSVMTLERGDIVYTGTPAGVGKVDKGDKIIAQLDDLVQLECSVI